MQERVKRGELFHLPSVDAYFDDKKHFEEIRSLCGYTHPVFDSNAVPTPKFGNLQEMRKHIEASFKMSFCDICISSRKVWTEHGPKRCGLSVAPERCGLNVAPKGVGPDSAVFTLDSPHSSDLRL